MNKVNPNEAPEGYVAVYQGKNLCTGCVSLLVTMAVINLEK